MVLECLQKMVRKLVSFYFLGLFKGSDERKLKNLIKIYKLGLVRQFKNEYNPIMA